MTEKFEQSIREWYNKSRTVNLEYLDLVENPKPKLSDLANNLGVVFDKICLLSKVSLKHFYTLSEENREIKEEVKKLRATVLSLEKQAYKPITNQEVK